MWYISSTLSYLPNIDPLTVNIYVDFCQNRLRVWAAVFERSIPFPELVISIVFSHDPTTQMCVSTLGSF